jgi:hypothetical protein
MSKYNWTVRRGRPPLPKDKVRGNRVVTFVTDAELAKLRAMTKDGNDTLSSVCHEIIAGYLNRKSAK